MSWYNNDEGFAQNNPKSKFTRRFWMKKDTKRLITFVDEPIIELNGVRVQTPFKYNEYNIQLNGSWRNYFTQPFNQQDDVLGQMDYKAAKVAALTVIDHEEWEDKNGVKHKDELTLYVVKRSSAVWKQILKFMEKEGSLSGKTFSLYRMDDNKAPAAGSILKKYEQNFTLNPSVHKPFNYLEILAPKSREELESLFHDPFKQGQQSQSFGNQQNNAWPSPDNGWNNGSQDSWNQQSGQSQQGDSRVYGATSNNGTIPF